MCSGDKTVKLWNKESGVCLQTLGDENTHGPTDGVTSGPAGGLAPPFLALPPPFCQRLMPLLAVLQFRSAPMSG